MIIHVVYECSPGVFTGGVSKMVFELAIAQSCFRKVEIWAISRCSDKTLEISQNLRIRYFAGRWQFGVVRSKELCEAISNDQEKISVIHSHNTFHPLNVQVGAMARKVGIPIFYNPHGALDPKLIERLSLRALKKRLYMRLAEIPCLNRASGVFALTKLEQVQLSNVGVRAPIHIVPNGFLPPKYKATEERSLFLRKLDIPDEGRCLLFVGRIVEKKAIHDIILSFAKLRERVSNVFLLIAGNEGEDADYSMRLRSIARDLKVEDGIRWLGFVDEVVKPNLYQVADIFVHASYSEGMAMAILEAMGEGIPVVATIGCYMGEAASENAILETEQSADCLADGMYSLLSDESARTEMITKAKCYLESRHRWEEIAKRSIEIYNIDVC